MDDSFLALSELSPFGVFWANAGGEWTYTNEKAAALLGLGQFGPRLWLRQVVERNRRAVGRSWRTAVTEGRPVTLDLPVVLEGVVEVLRLEAKPLRLGDGSIRGWVGTVRMTEVEERMAALEDRARTVLATVPDLLLQVDALDRYEGIYGGAKELLARPVEEVIGKHLSEVIADELLDRLLDAAHRAKQDGVVQSLDYQLETVSGLRDFEVRIAPTRRGGWMGLVRDITDRVRQADRLKDALERERHASEAKTRFLGNMSHELRTPLQGVLGMAQLLRLGGGLSEEQAQQLATLEGCGEALLAIIHDLLELSRVEAGQSHLAEEPVDLVPIVQQVVDAHQHEVQQNAVSMSIEVLSDHTTVLGDAARIRQCVVNLIGNSVKFAPGGRVELRIEECASHPGAVALRVADTGIGIPEQFIDRIFEPFSQVDASTSRSFGGLGLGLSISTELARAMGGGISVESEEGVGSTFTLWLPASEVAVAEVEEVPPLGPWLGEPLDILVAEDNPANGMLLRLLLQRDGHTVTLVTDGRAAVAAALEHDFDVLLFDLHMPGLDGLQASQQLQAKLGDAMAPIIVVTADGMPQTAARCREAGITSVLVKPYTPQSLQRHLRGAVEREDMPAA